MAATFDAKSGTGTNVVNATSVTVSHTCGASATALFVLVAYWSLSATQQDLTGVTYNGVSLTKVGASSRSNGQDIVEIYALAGPATGTHNIVASFRNSSAGNAGGVQGISFSGTPTSGGSGTLWADFTSGQTASNAANSSLSVPNNTSANAIVDAVAVGTAATPTMGTQTNRTLAASGNANGEGAGASYLAPGPTGSQTMNWTFSSTSSARAGVRVLAAGGTTQNLTVGGAATPTGALVETISKILVGSETPAGGLGQSVSKLFAGGATPAGALADTVSKILSGAQTPGGTLASDPSKPFGGSQTPTGGTANTAAKALAGEITPSGDVVNAVSRSVNLDGTLTPSGGTVLTVSKILAGTVAPSGSLVEAVSKILAGEVAPTGSLILTAVRHLDGAADSSGSLVNTTSRSIALDGEVAASGDVAVTAVPGVRVFPSIRGGMRTPPVLLDGVGFVLGPHGEVRAEGHVTLSARAAVALHAGVPSGTAEIALGGSGTVSASRTPRTASLGALVVRGRRISGAMSRPGSATGAARIVLAGQAATEATSPTIEGAGTQRLNALATTSSKGSPSADGSLRFNGQGRAAAPTPRIAALSANLTRQQASGEGMVTASMPVSLGRASNVQALVISGEATASPSRVAALAQRSWRDDPLELALLGLVEV